MKRNISIIGMAGVGKSFTSKQLADNLNYKYIEVDKIITEETKKIGSNKNTLSDKEFMTLEEKAVLSLKDNKDSVIDTGGSVIYSAKAMKILNEISFIIYLSDSPEKIKKRFDDRGEPHLIGMVAGMTFEKLLKYREALYEEYAHIKIDISKFNGNFLPKIVAEYKKTK